MNRSQFVVALVSVLLTGGTLSACGESAPANAIDNESVTNATENISAVVTPAAIPSAQAAPAFDWAGEYKGDFDGGGGEVSIASPDASGRHKVDLSVVGEGCSGQLTGNATLSGGAMILKQRDELGELCTVTMTRAGKGITVAENGCLYYHGMSCAFVGTVTKKGSAATTPAIRGPAWIVDAEVSAVRAVEDNALFLLHQCWVQGGARSYGLSIGKGDLRSGMNSASPDGRKFLTELGSKLRTATLRIVTNGEPPRTLTFARHIEPDADWGFNAPLDGATLGAIKRATHFELRLGSSTRTFSGQGAAKAIGTTECQESMHY